MKIFSTLKNLVCKYRHIFILACFLGILLVMSAWLYLETTRPAESNLTLERINEDYTIVTEPISPDYNLRQPFETDNPIHGGSFIFTIYDKICHGTLTLTLEDANGNALQSTNIDTTTLLDNTYHNIPFAEKITPTELSTYYYVLSFVPATPESELGIWVSESNVEGLLPYTLNGKDTNQTAGFSIIRNVAGSFISTSLLIFTIIALFFCIIIYCILFIFKLKLHLVFFIASVCLGIFYMFVLPPYVAPDEKVHIHTAYALSNDIFGIPKTADINLRSSDNIELDFADTASVFSYQKIYEDLFSMAGDTTIVEAESYTISSSPKILHIWSALGLTLGRIIGFNYITIILLGRLFNLIIYSLIVSLAIWLMPSFKRVIAIVALLPMSLQLAASFNYDCIVLATALLYTALVLHFAKQEQDLTYKQLALIAALGLLLAPMKILYIFLCSLCLIIPLKQCPKLVQKFMPRLLILGGILGVIGGILLLPHFGITKESLAEASSYVLPHVNPDSIVYSERIYWTPAYILTHLSGAIKLLARTIEENTALYFTQLVGGKAGEPILRDIDVWTPAVFALLVMLPISAIPTTNEKTLLTTGQKIFGAFICFATLAGLIAVCFTWTQLRVDTLWGLQGRYLLPIVPLVLLVCQNKLLVLNKNIERQLIFTSVFCNFIAIASIFSNIVKFEV